MKKSRGLRRIQQLDKGAGKKTGRQHLEALGMSHNTELQMQNTRAHP